MTISYIYKMYCNYSLLKLLYPSHRCQHALITTCLFIRLNDFWICFLIYSFFSEICIYEYCFARVLVYTHLKACYAFLEFICSWSSVVLDGTPWCLSPSMLKCWWADPVQESTIALSSWLQSMFLTQEITIIILFPNFLPFKFFLPSSIMFPSLKIDGRNILLDLSTHPSFTLSILYSHETLHSLLLWRKNISDEGWESILCLWL